MASPQVETVGTGVEKVKLALAAGLVVAAIVAFYMLAKQGQLAQWGALLACLVVAGVVFWSAETGKRLVAFGRDATRVRVRFCRGDGHFLVGNRQNVGVGHL